MFRDLKSLLLVPGLLLATGCGESQPEPESGEPAGMSGMAEMPGMAGMPGGAQMVHITQPQNGATVTGPDVTVSLHTMGLRVVEAGVFEPGTGHHHIFVNTDVTPMGEVIPAGQPGIIHLGLAQTEHVLEGLAPGEYRLIAVVGDGAHISLDPPVHDTIVFTVVPPSE